MNEEMIKKPDWEFLCENEKLLPNNTLGVKLKLGGCGVKMKTVVKKSMVFLS